MTFYEEAVEKIDIMFSDRSISRENCLENLNELKEKIEMLIDMMENEE
jgi:hypothetical protein